MPRSPSRHVDDPRLVGERLRAARKSCGLAQRALAFPGCTAAYISLIENGARIPSYQILRELARRLEVSADYLATGAEAPADDPFVEAQFAVCQGKNREANAVYQSFVSAGGSPNLVARAKIGLGLLAYESGELEDAIELLEQAYDKTAGPDGAVAADRLGRAYASTGRTEAALTLFKRQLAEARAREDPIEATRFGVLLATTQLEIGDAAAAKATLGEILYQAAECSDPTRRATGYWTRSRFHASRGEQGLSRRYAGLALTTLEAAEHARYIAEVFLLLGTLKSRQGRTCGAPTDLDEPIRSLAFQASGSMPAHSNRPALNDQPLQSARPSPGLMIEPRMV